MVFMWPLSTVAVHHSRKVGVASSILAVAFVFLILNEQMNIEHLREGIHTTQNVKGEGIAPAGCLAFPENEGYEPR